MFETTAEDGPVGSYSVSRVIQVSPRRILAAGGEETPVIRLLCDDPQMSDPFMTFVVDVLQKETEGAPIIRAIAQAAREWRELLSRAAGGLSGQEALGLYGEAPLPRAVGQRPGPWSVGDVVW
ncbi:PD-(D/E)XK motif protein [Rothia kristinae]|uniref:PD-(D/E)XK motif protein n=1 Tax=Rothia kristinae TaxID=37923 RepID=UPI00349F97F2